MAVTTFLAMTAGEIHKNTALPEHIGWMACHFSPYGLGLSNLPKGLPAGSLLILNDRIPIHGHSPHLIGEQLKNLIANEGCEALLLDFQRPNREETTQLVRHLFGVLPCPVVVSEPYAQVTHGPVLLSPLPHHVPLAEYVRQRQGREIWLELALDAEQIRLTEEGASVTPLSTMDIPDDGHQEEFLHCHYCAEKKEDSVVFTLWRTREDLRRLMDEAQTIGITNTVGLYQELGIFRHT